MSGRDDNSKIGSNKGKLAKEEVDECSTLSKNFILQSPNQAIVKSLKVGDKLNILVGNSNSRIIVVQTLNGDMVGTLIGISMIAVLNCIEKDYRYIGIITKIDGGACHINVRPYA